MKIALKTPLHKKTSFMKHLRALSFHLFFPFILLHAQEKDPFVAARIGDVQTIEVMLNQGLSIDTTNAKGFTMLTFAVYNKQNGLTNFLIERGADVNKTDFMGNTPLMSAAFKGETEIAKRLIEKGAKVNDRNTIGMTALMFAAMAGRKETSLALVEKGADLNAIDQRGFTAIALAIHKGADEIAELLSAIAGEKSKVK